MKTIVRFTYIAPFRPANIKRFNRMMSYALSVTFLWGQLCWAGDIVNPISIVNKPTGSMTSDGLQKSQASAQGSVDAKNDAIVMASAIPAQADQVKSYPSSGVTYYSQGYSDIIGDFGSNGMYEYTNDKWSLISYLNADSFTLAPLNNGSHDIIIDFGSNGMWKYADNKWNFLSYLNADSFTIAPLNSGTYDIIGDFGSSGMWKYSNNQWAQLSTSNADSFTLSPLNSNTYDIIGDCRKTG